MKKKSVISKAAGDMNAQDVSLLRSQAPIADLFSAGSRGERGVAPPLSALLVTLIRW
jgi:hypothetical protein